MKVLFWQIENQLIKIIEMETEEGRNKGVRKDDGKILKGTLKEAPMKLKVSSIPSKIENIIYSNHHKAAFGNSQERFSIPTHTQLAVTPGPGNYFKPDALYKNVDSKKGFGFLASETTLSRFNSKRNWNPGPGRYEVQTERRTKSNSSILKVNLQARELFDSEIRAAKEKPGPGNYEQRLFRSSSCAATAFKSKKERFLNFQNEIPGVGQYQWEKIKNKVKSLKIIKKSVLIQQSYDKSFHQRCLDKILGDRPDTSKEVGPGKYNPSLLEPRKTFSIKDDHKGRFGVREPPVDALKQSAEDNFERNDGRVPSRVVNSHASIFNSKSRRYEFGQNQSKMVGDPWKYSPTKGGKNSHLINFSKKWV